jgi:flagellar hook-basal body complex protein FliE
MMSIEAIYFLPASQSIQTESASLSQIPATSFEGWMTDRIDQVNDKLVNAEQQVRRLAVGDVDNLHQVMINLEEAKLDFQLTMQIRNRVLDAYQEILRMQV